MKLWRQTEGEVDIPLLSHDNHLYSYYTAYRQCCQRELYVSLLQIAAFHPRIEIRGFPGGLR